MNSASVRSFLASSAAWRDCGAPDATCCDPSGLDCLEFPEAIGYAADIVDEADIKDKVAAEFSGRSP